MEARILAHPQKLFEFRATTAVLRANIFAYSPHPDGRFLVNVTPEAGEPTVNVVTNGRKYIADRQAAGNVDR